MQRLFAILALLLSCECCSAQDVGGFRLAEGSRELLPATEGSAVLNQCSRDAPRSNDGYWSPSATDVMVLEEELVKSFATRQKVGLRVPPANEYSRQYVGLFKGGRRYIYGNFYPKQSSVSDPKQAKAFVVCDGGPAFWGVVFDVERQAFDEPLFNGPSW